MGGTIRFPKEVILLALNSQFRRASGEFYSQIRFLLACIVVDSHLAYRRLAFLMDNTITVALRQEGLVATISVSRNFIHEW